MNECEGSVVSKRQLNLQWWCCLDCYLPSGISSKSALCIPLQANISQQNKGVAYGGRWLSSHSWFAPGPWRCAGTPKPSKTNLFFHDLLSIPCLDDLKSSKMQFTPAHYTVILISCLMDMSRSIGTTCWWFSYHWPCWNDPALRKLSKAELVRTTWEPPRVSAVQLLTVIVIRHGMKMRNTSSANPVGRNFHHLASKIVRAYISGNFARNTENSEMLPEISLMCSMLRYHGLILAGFGTWQVPGCYHHHL